jgi:hypothetical protein
MLCKFTFLQYKDADQDKGITEKRGEADKVGSEMLPTLQIIYSILLKQDAMPDFFFKKNNHS